MQNPSRHYPIVSVILAGGVGQRLWPISTPERPKPLLAPDGGPSLLRQTLRRATQKRLLVCGAAHAERMQQEAFLEGEIDTIIEPEGRNTAAALCVAALSLPPESMMLVLPSDHWISAQEGFEQTIDKLVSWAQQGYLMTIGIAPDHPSSDYGYIETGEPLGEHSWKVASFLEKPDTATARARIEQGCYWNSGIFMWRADVLIEQARLHCPQIVDACEAALQQATQKKDTTYLEATAWSACPAAPIDRAVLERTDRAAMVEAQFEWSDLGSFEALKRCGITLS